MATVTEVVDRPILPMGFINPDVPPLTEKENTFAPHDLNGNLRTIADADRNHTAEHHGFGDATSKTSSLDEKKQPDVNVDEMVGMTTDPFVPFDDLPDERHQTSPFAPWSSAASATGWTFGASLFGAIIGFAVLKPLGRALPEKFPILGGSFGPRENNIVQTAATAAGGLSSVFISGIPAMHSLGLLSTPEKDFPRLITLTIVGGYFGFAFATPLRKFFIIYLARELRLIFPTPSATAMTIRSMHAAASGEAIAKLKMRALGIAFSLAFIQRVVSQYWIFIWSKYSKTNYAIDIEVGINTAVSYYAGSILAWGIIGPSLIHTGAAWGKQIAPKDPDWDRYMSFGSLSAAASNKDHPSPRFWLLWPGVLLMIVVSFTELFLQYKLFGFIAKAIWRGSCEWLNTQYSKRKGKQHAFLSRQGVQDESDLVEDPALPHEQVKWWMWLPLLVLVIIMTCVVMGVQFEMPVGMSLLAVFLAFFFSFLAVQCAGVTDITPLTAASKASQIVLGGATKGEHWATSKAQRLNLLGGSIASMGANQASDLVGDFRVGFLLRTPPTQQWIAQGLGTIVAVFLAPALYILFVKAYPCVIDPEAETCPFAGPSIAAWRAVAVAVTDPVFPVPRTSGIFAIVFACFGGFMSIVRHYGYKGKMAKYRVYHPNFMCIGLAFTMVQTYYGLAMIIGAVPSYFWAKRSPKSFDIYGFAIAAVRGLIAGEGIGGVLNAVFQIAGIAGPDPYGTQIACPANLC
nr:hypothetical protein B0A51_14125 [Rachicladosporium sp. CCFEE 5018]